MTTFEVPVWCVGAAVFGVLMGYLFARSARQQQPNGSEIAALLGTVLGGAALTLIKQFDQCTVALPLYVIGVAVGYALYAFVLNKYWVRVAHLIEHHGLQRTPLFPWRATDPCCNCQRRDTDRPQT